MRRVFAYLVSLALVLSSVSVAAAQQPARQGGSRQGGSGPQGQTLGGNGGRGRGQRGPVRPAPRNAEGRVLLQGATAAEKGVWLPQGVITTSVAPADQIPFQPWAKALYEDRQTHRLEPHARCKPSGAARQIQTPYGLEFVELPEAGVIYMFDIGGPHTYRVIYMDGRSHPRHPTPSYYGHSIGWWDGDTLVVDTVGYNEGFWMDRGGTPHTDRLHTMERFTRSDQATIRYELTVDDPGAYTAPWTARLTMRWENGTELFEYVCQEQNYAPNLMVGTFKSVDRSDPVVP